MRKFYLTFPKFPTVSGKLSWSHYFEILKADDDLEINFYLKQCEKENRSVRELKRQMKSMLYKIVLIESAMRNDGGSFTDREIHCSLRKKGIKNPDGEWFECNVCDVKAVIAGQYNI